MPHSLIIGMTESGKTTLVTNMSRSYRENGIKVIILDPLLDPRWQADYITSDPLEFMTIVQNPETKNCAIFIDESGEMVGQYTTEMFWLATRARHYGHNTHFISQRAAQLNPTVRDQCSYLFLFNCSQKDAKELSNGWNREIIQDAHTLGKGEYFLVPRWGDIQKRNVFIEAGYDIEGDENNASAERTQRQDKPDLSETSGVSVGGGGGGGDSGKEGNGDNESNGVSGTRASTS